MRLRYRWISPIHRTAENVAKGWSRLAAQDFSRLARFADVRPDILRAITLMIIALFKIVRDGLHPRQVTLCLGRIKVIPGPVDLFFLLTLLRTAG